ncbi:basic proline-rich protein-like [Parus major]|uniref:basic proline-rich protein-like n=1 Tax=Parus major TaxID=9157 RepID=UPI000771411D|nr:basic proline-rich protein-like [Parus major]
MHHRLKPSKITASLCSAPDCGTATAEAHGQARDSSEPPFLPLRPGPSAPRARQPDPERTETGGGAAGPGERVRARQLPAPGPLPHIRRPRPRRRRRCSWGRGARPAPPRWSGPVLAWRTPRSAAGNGLSAAARCRARPFSVFPGPPGPGPCCGPGLVPREALCWDSAVPARFCRPPGPGTALPGVAALPDERSRWCRVPLAPPPGLPVAAPGRKRLLAAAFLPRGPRRWGADGAGSCPGGAPSVSGAECRLPRGTPSPRLRQGDCGGRAGPARSRSPACRPHLGAPLSQVGRAPGVPRPSRALIWERVDRAGTGWGPGLMPGEPQPGLRDPAVRRMRMLPGLQGMGTLSMGISRMKVIPWCHVPCGSIPGFCSSAIVGGSTTGRAMSSTPWTNRSYHQWHSLSFQVTTG